MGELRSAGQLTVVNLLQGNLCILWKTLLSLAAEHEGFRLLWWCHRCMMLGIHHMGHSKDSKDAQPYDTIKVYANWGASKHTGRYTRLGELLV